MSRIVEATELRDRDIFEMPNGSVYAATGSVGAEGVPRARLWCAHAPEPTTFDPPPIDLAPGQQVRLLDGHESDGHFRHDGYVELVFHAEMDRRHQAMMRSVYEQRQRADAAQRRDDRARRPWWSTLFDVGSRQERNSEDPAKKGAL